MMASSDVGFVSALMRIRLRSYQSGVNASGLSSSQDALGLKGKAHFFSTLLDTVKFMTKVSMVGGTGGLSARSRWDRPSDDFDTGIDPSAFSAGVGAHVTNEGSAAGSSGAIPIQDLFAPVSPLQLLFRLLHPRQNLTRPACLARLRHLSTGKSATTGF